MLWLYDSRDRLQGKRELYVLPLTNEGKRKAWDIVLTEEVPNVRKNYQYLMDNDATYPEVADCELFNSYWAEYGWFLTPVEPYAEIPHDAEVVK